MTENRLLLCRPQGGLNDLLCQIEAACRYADRFGRTVIVETNAKSSSYFRDDFSKYFASRHKSLILTSSAHSRSFDDVDAVPHAISGRVNDYLATYDREQGNFVDRETNVLLSFDHTRDYAEPLLLHHACGGGQESLKALGRMSLSGDILDELASRISSIGSQYDAMHIRHTDYRTDYENRLSNIQQELDGPFFVATDNAVVLEFCSLVFDEGSLYSFSNLDSKDHAPLHGYFDRALAYQRNSDAIIDLFMLALSRVLVFFELAPNPEGATYSGFSVLAQGLKARRKLLRQLITRENGHVDRVLWPHLAGDRWSE